MRRFSVLILIAIAAMVSSAGVASAEDDATIPPPCKVKDSPTPTFTPPFMLEIDLHTEVECFERPVSVG